MSERVYWIEGAWPGRLAISPRPAGGEWLEDEIRSWSRAGVNRVVSLLTPDEVSYLELAREEEVCQAYNISFVSFPIDDLGVPDSSVDARALIAMLERSLAEGNSILVHCQGGIGRSGLITSCVLVRSGIEPGEAMQRASTARRLCVPETKEQQQWVREYADEADTLY